MTSCIFRCGLVSLHMAAQLLKKLNSSTPDLSLPEIFRKALDMKITKQGEMFSGGCNYCSFALVLQLPVVFQGCKLEI